MALDIHHQNLNLQPEQALLYPEEYIIEEDLAEMGDINPHTNLIELIKAILKYLFEVEGWLVVSNMNLYHPLIRNSARYIVPDVMLVKIRLPAEEEQYLSSWQAERQAPAVVFEVSSESTWEHDVEDQDKYKPAIYGRIGVKEYFAYDPNRTPVWRGQSSGVRLRGWRYDELGTPHEIEPDATGRLWSEELASWLEADGDRLRLTDRAGQVRLTGFQAAIIARQQAELQAEAETTARQQAELQALTETTARQQAEIQAEAEINARQQAELRAALAEERARAAEQALAELRRQTRPDQPA